MNPDLLLKEFHRISEAPDAVPRLRQFILQLAVKGKLVAQDESDEPASKLLTRIRGSAVQNPEPLNLHELGGLPRNWAIARLMELGRWALGCGFP